jgi:sugar/nucleoside kinase (ribokinase family)
MIAITPDAERTMCTFLGAATAIDSNDIEAELIAQSKVVYFEGYLWDEPHAKEAIKTAMSAAKEAGVKISFSLSDSFCVERHRDEFWDLVDNYVDILFCNEDEAYSLCQANDFDICRNQLEKTCEIVNITRGAKGAVILQGNQQIEVPAKEGVNLVDTTGAGDLYAAGFLYGYTQGYSLLQSGRLAVEAASEIIQHVGARPEIALSTLIEDCDRVSA